jgi:hypothetical protein
MVAVVAVAMVVAIAFKPCLVRISSIIFDVFYGILCLLDLLLISLFFPFYFYLYSPLACKVTVEVVVFFGWTFLAEVATVDFAVVGLVLANKSTSRHENKNYETSQATRPIASNDSWIFGNGFSNGISPSKIE